MRSPDNQFVIFPSGRLQVDSYFFKSGNKVPNDTFLVKRARAELAGWVGSMFFFNIAGDFAAGAPNTGSAPITQANLNATDDYVALAPWGDLAILQVGQFDAPFTLENRTSDKYFDFMERSIAVRAFGVPTNKEVGAMAHGLLPNNWLYYSFGVFDGEGQNYRNADKQFDFIGRGWVAPFALAGIDAVRAVTVGGSGWYGKHDNGLPVPSQSTQAGFGFWSAGPKAAELHQGINKSFALELNAPVLHRAGVRLEWVHKDQTLRAQDLSKAGMTTALGSGRLKGWAGYVEGWFWLLGDDRIIGEPGLQLPPRFKKFGVKPPQQGLMVAVRLDQLSETTTDPSMGSSVAGDTKVKTIELGLNYWYSKRFRGTFNYVHNSFDGDAPGISMLKSEQEFMFRLAIAL